MSTHLNEKRNTRYLWMVLWSVAVATGTSEPSLAQGGFGAGELAKVNPRVRLQISPPAQSTRLVEHTTLELPYAVTVLPGVGGARPAVDLVVCADEQPGMCDVYDQVRANWRSPTNRKLRLTVPNAGRAVEFKIVACRKAFTNEQVVTCGERLGEAEFQRPVAARFVVGVDSFTILHTRARSADTVHVAASAFLSGSNVDLLKDCTNILGNPTLSKPILCKGPARIGMQELGNGTYPVGNMKVGEFELVPGAGGAVTFAFVVFNYGFPVQSQAVSGSMEGNVQNAMRAQLTTLNQRASEDFVSNLNAPPWLGCDGPTAAGAVRWFNTDRPDSLDALTRSTGSYTADSKVFVVRSQAGCGDDSRYQVRWTLRRTSW